MNRFLHPTRRRDLPAAPDEPAQTHRTLASAERTGLAHPRSVPAHNQARGLAPAASRTRESRRRDNRERDG
jgi:hypothetical protein